MSVDRDNIKEIVKSFEAKFIDLQFTDLPGKLQHVTIMLDGLDESYFESGFPKLDGSSIRGFVDIHESDMVLMPDYATMALDPFREIKTIRVLCDVYLGEGKGRFLRDPRWIAQKAEKYLEELGIDRSYWGPEVEFFVFNKARWDVSIPSRGLSYEIDSAEAAWNSGSYPIRFKEGYYPTTPQDTLMDFRNECTTILKDTFGIRVDSHHHEVATAGQCEIDMVYNTLTRMADYVQTCKYVVKNVAKKHGLMATFMPKPVYMDNASGMHVHSSLWSGGENLFYDPDDKYAELSQVGRYYVGGLIEHSRALAAIVCPTTNSYKRLVPGYEAPVYIAWSKSNRSANIRIPVYQIGKPSSKRVEFRTPDPSCNPYLAFAAILMAGLDGIKKKIDPGDPIDANIYHLTPEARRSYGIRELPSSLFEAAEELESDNEFLKPVFTSDLIETIVSMEKNMHLQVFSMPHPYEFYLYFDA